MRNSDISAEEKLLLALCHLEFGVELQKSLRSLVAEVNDWQYFSHLANQHGIAALVFYNLDSHGLTDIIPDEVFSFLRKTYMKSLAANSRNFQLTGKALDILESARIKTVLLKGMALEIMVYGNKGLRQMNDADVLTGKEDCIKAYRLLKREGYISLPVKSLLHKPIILDTGKHLPSLIKNDFSLELHHELFGRRVLTQYFLDNSLKTELDGGNVFLPQPMIFFLYLVKHLHSHELNNESQLRLYTDLVVLIEKYKEEIINQNLLALAEQAELNEILSLKLKLLRDFWNMSYPDWLNMIIDERENPESEKKFLFFLKSPKNNPVIDNPGSYRDKIKQIPGFHRKVLYVTGDLFPTITFMKKRYKCSTALKAILHYPHRFGKLVWLFR